MQSTSTSSAVLNVTTTPPQESTSTPVTSYTYYHAGPLFTLGELHTNTLLSRAIKSESNARFIPLLPQDLEQRDRSPHAIRDQDIITLLSADLALFVYDGTELDSGTVVEFMVAKMADIPAVILRTDFRGAGDQAMECEGEGGDPWNLMCGYYPRMEKVIVNSILAYKTGLATAMRSGRVSGPDVPLLAGELMLDEVAREVIQAFERVLQRPAALPADLRESVYKWLGIMPGFRDGMVEGNEEAMLTLCREKAEKGLL